MKVRSVATISNERGYFNANDLENGWFLAPRNPVHDGDVAGLSLLVKILASGSGLCRLPVGGPDQHLSMIRVIIPDPAGEQLDNVAQQFQA